jgi:hypothetical protein
MFILGGIFTYSFFPRLNKSQDYNDHIRQQIEVCKAKLIKEGFTISESKIHEYYYLGITDFIIFKAEAGYEKVKVIGLEIDEGIYLHARFWFKLTNTFVIYEVI